MTFKKDYINYLLHTVVNTGSNGFRDNYRLSKLVDTIMSVDDVMKVTYLIGKTAGLEGLFKYLLYISDKIDKSQVTIFNLKDNFDYDIKNLVKICEKISEYKSETVQEAIENITEEMVEEEVLTDEENVKDAISINVDDNSADNIVKMEETGEESAETEEDTEDGGLTLIENTESYSDGPEVFELESITDSVENSELIENKDAGSDQDEKVIDEDESEITDEDSDELKHEETSDEQGESEEADVFELEQLEEEDAGEKHEATGEIIDETTEEITGEDESGLPEDSSPEDNTQEDASEKSIEEQLPELEIEVHKPVGASQDEEHIKEEPITNEAYYKFETKFFEEVKILEKLFASVDKDCRLDEAGKLSEKCLQCLTEIIEITSELSSLSRQLSFDLIADIFLTMNLYFTKAISQPDILSGERIKLLDSSLALVNSLIKGEDYLNYDTIVDKIEELKSDITGDKEEIQLPEEIIQEEIKEKENYSAQESQDTEQIEEEITYMPEKTDAMQSQMASAVFKLKYLVKEFEKSFTGISSMKGEYSKFDALEKISELNNALRLIAKIAAIIKMNDVLKLAEVTYVFLKYVKDYRMDLMEPEIKQIVKYIIFTFKMLLTDRKPEDFNVLVQHLNNPVKIFADS
jgi:hypothetical protein